MYENLSEADEEDLNLGQFQSKFLINFTNNLENIIRQDIKEDDSRPESKLLRALS
jgi:hypothetical protein